MAVLEVNHGGALIKIPSAATTADFVEAVSCGNPIKSAAVLLSLVVQSGGLKQVSNYSNGFC